MSSGNRANDPDKRAGKLRGKWVTIRSFGTSEEAHLVKLVLDRAGIPCYIDNENTGTMLWHAQPAVGGIGVRVPAPFEQQAVEVIESRGRVVDAPDDSSEGSNFAEDGEEEEREFPDESDGDEPYEADEDDYGGAAGQVCPACFGTGVVRFSWMLRIGQVLLVLLLGGIAFVHPVLIALVLGGAVYLLVTKPDYRCLRCGHRWTAGR